MCENCYAATRCAHACMHTPTVQSNLSNTQHHLLTPQTSFFALQSFPPVQISVSLLFLHTSTTQHCGAKMNNKKQALLLLGAGVVLGWSTSSIVRWARHQLLQLLFPLGEALVCRMQHTTVSRIMGDEELHGVFGCRLCSRPGVHPTTHQLPSRRRSAFQHPVSPA